MNILRIISAFIWLLAAVKCYPLGISDTEDKLELKEEMKFPNGTVVGKYAYTDKDGNPVQVKYYADEASYGVELNSIKVVNAIAEPPKLQFKPELPMSSDPVFDPSTTLLDPAKYPGPASKKYKASDTLQSTNKHYNKKLESHKTSPDYDIFLQNDLNVPKKCEKDKIRVYNFEKDKRKIRNVYNMYNDASKFCEQF